MATIEMTQVSSHWAQARIDELPADIEWNATPSKGMLQIEDIPFVIQVIGQELSEAVAQLQQLRDMQQIVVNQDSNLTLSKSLENLQGTIRSHCRQIARDGRMFHRLLGVSTSTTKCLSKRRIPVSNNPSADWCTKYSERLEGLSTQLCALGAEVHMLAQAVHSIAAKTEDWTGSLPKMIGADSTQLLYMDQIKDNRREVNQLVNENLYKAELPTKTERERALLAVMNRLKPMAEQAVEENPSLPPRGNAASCCVIS